MEGINMPGKKIESDSNIDQPTDPRKRTVSQGVNLKTGEGMRLGPWTSFEEFAEYAKALAAEDYDNDLDL
jgi:hypothetical protein